VCQFDPSNGGDRDRAVKSVWGHGRVRCPEHHNRHDVPDQNGRTRDRSRARRVQFGRNGAL
jgi:hypothetical protein